MSPPFDLPFSLALECDGRVEAFPKHQRYASSMSIDVSYIADNRRFSVSTARDAENGQRNSDLIRIVGLRLAHGNIGVLRRIDWILDGSWGGLHGSPKRMWKHVEPPALRCGNLPAGRAKKKRAD